MTMPGKPILVDADTVARMLGCSSRTVRRLARAGVLAAKPLPGGRKYWFDRAVVEAQAALLRETIRREAERRRDTRESLLQMWLDLH